MAQPPQSDGSAGEGQDFGVVGNPNEQARFAETEPHIATGQTWIAKALVVLFCVIATLILLLLFFSKLAGLDPRDVRDTGEAIISPIVALLGSVIGFYYGKRERSWN